jgi:hypothetical protein
MSQKSEKGLVGWFAKVYHERPYNSFFLFYLSVGNSINHLATLLAVKDVFCNLFAKKKYCNLLIPVI